MHHAGWDYSTGQHGHLAMYIHQRRYCCVEPEYAAKSTRFDHHPMNQSALSSRKWYGKAYGCGQVGIPKALAESRQGQGIGLDFAQSI